MSQAKVDKRKYEKIHRKEIEKKRKIRIAVHCVIAALILGAIIGVPLGIRIYRSIPKFVGDSTLEAFVSTYIDDNYASDIAVLGSKNDSTESADTTEEQDPVDVISDAINEATANSSEEAEDVDSDSTEDNSEDSETSETSEAE